ncbi:MAG: hypothetical protein Q8K11_14850, partial [Phenylobacterium sp.]|uniref:hypothetical protein n=1 Tax=Phenylobacterium sp. TaxID=1871053 RepID=UPI002731CC30
IDETGYLTEMEEIADSGVTPAERLLELYNGPWAGDASKVFEAFAYYMASSISPCGVESGSSPNRWRTA